MKFEGHVLPRRITEHVTKSCHLLSNYTCLFANFLLVAHFLWVWFRKLTIGVLPPKVLEKKKGRRRGHFNQRWVSTVIRSISKPKVLSDISHAIILFPSHTTMTGTSRKQPPNHGFWSDYLSKRTLTIQF